MCLNHTEKKSFLRSIWAMIVNWFLSMSSQVCQSKLFKSITRCVKGQTLLVFFNNISASDNSSNVSEFCLPLVPIVSSILRILQLRWRETVGDCTVVYWKCVCSKNAHTFSKRVDHNLNSQEDVGMNQFRANIKHF